MTFSKLLESHFITFPELETERLRLVELNTSFKDDILEIFSNPDVVKFYDLPLLTDISEAEEFINRHKTNYQYKREIRWGMILKEENKLIGTCGIAPENFDIENDCDNIGLGFDENRSYWGRRYMKEALKEIISFCFNFPEINKMHIENINENINCTKLAGSLNFKRLKTHKNIKITPDWVADVDYYELSRETY